MAAPGDTQGSALVGFGGPLKEIANLHNTTSSASTPSTKDLDQKEFISPVVAQLAQVLAEHLKGTTAAQTPGSASSTVPGTPDSAIVSLGLTGQTREPTGYGSCKYVLNRTSGFRGTGDAAEHLNSQRDCRESFKCSPSFFTCCSPYHSAPLAHLR